MKKILILFLGIILTISLVIVLVKGVTVGNLKILSIRQIMDESEKLDDKIEKASTLSNIDYPNSISKLNDSNKNLIVKKEDYADLVSLSSEEDIESATEIETYDIDFLWTKIGRHATGDGLSLGIEVVNSFEGYTDKYNLNFTCQGPYISVSEFIRDIENDSSLSFKIENFSLIPAGAENENKLTAKFSVKNIGINADSISSVASQSNQTINNSNDERMSEDMNNTSETENIDDNTTTNTVE